MSAIEIKLPDIGEGIVEAEISEWQTEVGAWIAEDEAIAVVLTDKAAVEIPSDVSGKVVWLAGEPGDLLAVGAPLIRIEAADSNATRDVSANDPAAVDPSDDEADELGPEDETSEKLSRKRGVVLAASAVRKRALALSIDLNEVKGTGPDARVTHSDLDNFLLETRPDSITSSVDGVTETKLIGLRRKIAEQMTLAHTRIPQITIVEEFDVTELERLRGLMNVDRLEVQEKLTMLPFLIRGIVVSRSVAPQINTRFDDEAEIVRQYDAMHFGIATQTPNGLVVPVLRHAENKSVWSLASEIKRLADGARDGSLPREEMSGSTITVTSLGTLGAVATTPIINHPEVAIFGVNRKQLRPQWDGQSFVPREVMNLSASFDHRIVDGWDAAVMIARLKAVLETPALLFA